MSKLGKKGYIKNNCQFIVYFNTLIMSIRQYDYS